MNKHLHRIIFNAVRGMRMVVQETASSTGKGASKSTARRPGTRAALLFGVLVVGTVNAQIVGAPNVPGNLRPTVLVAPNGVPLINIQTPSAAGVSRNVYNQFNVAPQGAIFNNSRTHVQTQLGGIVQGNPFLARGPARIILNEVNGGSPSQLRGYIEVGGSRAEVVIANPAGINVDGAGFINASRATLTTGVPQMNAFGGLDNFLVRGGTVTINGAGLDVSKTDYAAILARAVEANAGIWASELKVVTGANTVSADHAQITPTTGTGAAPTFALDVAALGGMYAGKIVLIGTEAGLGVRNAGTVQAAPGTPLLAGAGQLVVTAAGRLENTGTLEGSRVEVSSAGVIDNRNGGTIRQTSSAALAISAPALSNAGGGVIGPEPLSQSPSQPGNASPGTASSITTASSTPVPASGAGSGATIASAPYVPPSPGTITAAGAILNDGGRIYAGGAITLQSANVNNSGGTMNLASMTLAQPSFENRGGTLNISNGFSAKVDRFDNTGGKLNAGSLNIASSGDLINVDGTLTSASDARLTVGGTADNTRGSISATGALTANVTGAANNTGGTLASNQGLAFDAGSLDNTKGSIQSAQAGVQLAVANQLVNGAGGAIGAATDLSVGAGDLVNAGTLRGSNDINVAVGGAFANDGSVTAGRHTTIRAGSLQSSAVGVLGAGVQNDGKLGSVGDLRVTTSGALLANGNNIAAGNAMLQGASVDLSGSQTSAANIAITATQGDVITSKATVVTPGTLSVTANSNAAQTLVNDAGKLNANQLDLKLSNIANTNAGEIVQTGADATRITVAGSIANTAGIIASNGDMRIAAGSLSNRGGAIRAALASSLDIDVKGQLDNSHNGVIGAGGNTAVKAATLDNSLGTVTAVKGDLGIATTGATTNDQGTLQAGAKVVLSNGGLINTGGKVLGDSLSVNTGGNALDNSQGGTLAATTTVDVESGALNNEAGLVQSGGAMTIDTDGKRLTNANAAKYITRQGGIASGDTLTLKNVGEVDNRAGFIGAKNALNAQAQAFDNSGGQTQAAGDLEIDTGRLVNAGGLIRSALTTTLNATRIANNETSGADKGIEGKSVVIGTGSGDLDNSSGAIRADVDATLTSGGTLTNSKGLISAGNELSIRDPNRANPGAKTLKLVNTNGTLVADNRLDIDAATFSGDGRVVSGKDLGIALTQDIVNNGEVAANGNLSYTTTGNFTNNGKLLAGQTLTVGGNNVDNAANAEMSATNTTVNAAGTLTNRGLIDSQGATQIHAGRLNNIGTGRIYGDAVSVAVGTLDNDAENGKGATIAARDTLHIGATTIDNREHSLLFSAGGLFIGGALDADRLATGRGGILQNLSASIESLGDMSIAMDRIDNRDTHVRLGPQATTVTGPVMTVAPKGASRMYTTDEVVVMPGQPYVWARNADGSTGALLYSNGFGIWQSMATKTADTAVDADPARIVAGGSMTLDAQVSNNDSRIVGRTVQARRIRNEALQGTGKTDVFATVVDETGKQQPNVIRPGTPGTVDVGAFEYRETANATTGYAIGSANTGGVSTRSAGAGVVGGGNGPGVIVQVPANVGAVVGADGSAAGNATAATRTIPMVVRTSQPNAAIPQTSLFGLHAGPRGYLIETDPRFANYRNWLGSDYLLNNLGLDPNHTLKRLGDGFYEQRLIREQVAQLTGYRYLDGQYNDDAQYTALMNSGATFAREYGLRPGIALTPAQMAQLTSDIVWLVEQTVTLPDGSTQQVLAPQVYVRVRPGDIDGSGALLAGNQVRIDGRAHDLVNTGTIAGRELVRIDASTVGNLGGRISGGQVDLKAQGDIDNIGGVIDARDRLSLTAGRDINVRTTTGTALANVGIDRVAGLYVTDPGSVLTIKAARDVNLIGAVISNSGKDSFTSITADKSIHLGTVTEQSQLTVLGAGSIHSSASSKDVGSTIVGNGTVLLDAKGGDIDLRAATIDAGSGVLGLTASGDVNILAGEETRSMLGHSQTKKKRGLKSVTTTIDSETQSTSGIGSRLSGESVGVFAGGDINVLGSDIAARRNALLRALGDVNIVSSIDSASASLDTTRTIKGLIAPKLGGSSIDRKRSLSQHAGVSSQTQRASNVTAGENLSITADKRVRVFASHLGAGEDLKVRGAQVTILSGIDETSREVGTRTVKNSIGTMGNPKRSGKGMNGKSSVTDSVQQSTLAPATLTGRNITLTATEGDLTLGAVQIRADEQVALAAPNGRVIMGVVRTTTEVNQSRGESDPMYQRTRDTGAYAEAASYTRIDSKTLALDTPHLTVALGQNTVKGPNGATAAQQTIAQVLQAQRGQPGMGWLQQIQNDPALSNLQIDWQGVPLEQRQWAERKGSLTETGGAVVAIVVAVLSWGAASGVGAAASSAVGGGTAGTVVGSAVTAAVSSIASQAAVSLINNNGDVGRVVEDLTSSQGIKNTLTAMATAGALRGLSVSGVLPGSLANATNGSAPFMNQLGRQLIDRTASALIHHAINGGSLQDSLQTAIATAFLNTAGAQTAFAIGQAELDAFSANVAHAIAGCAVGAGRGAVGGRGASGGCAPGAVGALVGHLGGGLVNPGNDPKRMDETINFSRLMAGIAGGVVGGNAASIDIAAQAGETAVQNNQFGRVARSAVLFCKLFPAQCVAQAEGHLVAGALIAERIRQERQRNPALSENAAEATVLADIMARGMVNGAVDGVKAIASWFESTPPAPAGAPGFGADGVPRMPDSTGNTSPPPSAEITTGGEQVVQPNRDGNIAGGGYGAGGAPNYGGPTATPNNGPAGPQVLMSQSDSGQPVFGNQLPERLRAETAAANAAGVRPISPTDPSFESVVNQGQIKFVITIDGDIFLAPHTSNGFEISHAVLSGGKPVISAGQADISGGPESYVGTDMDPHSGHFLNGATEYQTAISDKVARAAFERIGIKFFDKK